MAKPLVSWPLRPQKSCRSTSRPVLRGVGTPRGAATRARVPNLVKCQAGDLSFGRGGKGIARVANIDHGGDRRSDEFKRQICPLVSQAEAATRLNVSERSVRTAAVVLRDADPEVIAAVKRGEIATKDTGGSGANQYHGSVTRPDTSPATLLELGISRRQTRGEIATKGDNPGTYRPGVLSPDTRQPATLPELGISRQRRGEIATKGGDQGNQYQDRLVRLQDKGLPARAGTHPAKPPAASGFYAILTACLLSFCAVNKLGSRKEGAIE